MIWSFYNSNVFPYISLYTETEKETNSDQNANLSCAENSCQEALAEANDNDSGTNIDAGLRKSNGKFN